MQETTITLQFRLRDFREIYYRHGRGNIFISPKTRLNIWLTILFLGTATVLYFLSVHSNSMGLIVLLLLCVIAIVFFFIQLVVNLTKHFQWKRNVETYLKEAATYQSNSIVVNNTCMEFINDGEINIENWDAFKSVNIQPAFISIAGGITSYLLPAKSMQTEEFNFLTNTIKEKVEATALTEFSQPEDTIEA